MFKMKLTARGNRRARLRNLYPRAVKALEQRIQFNVQPKVANDVQNYIAPYPGPVVYPFQFASLKSQRFYFANFSLPYQRTMTLRDSWIVGVSGAMNTGPLSILNSIIRQRSVVGTIQMFIGNADPASAFVYRPRQVTGHANTGWGQELDANQAKVLSNAKEYIADEWGPAIVEAIES